MRRSCGPLLLAALILSAHAAAAEPAGAGHDGAASGPKPQGPEGPAPAPPPSAAPAQPREDPPYNPWEHGGLSYGAWLRATRGTGRRSTGMMITGLSFVGLAATLMATGTGVYFASNSCGSAGLPVPVDGPVPLGGQTLPCGPSTSHTTGLVVLASGVIALGLGIPLTVLGAAEVPRAEAASLSPGHESDQRARPAAFVSLSLGMGSGGLALHF